MGTTELVLIILIVLSAVVALAVVAVVVSVSSPATHGRAGGPVPVGRPLRGGFGNYRIKRRIGVGGMAEVYEAVEPGTRSRVALKVMRANVLSDPSLVQRFEFEANVLQAVARIAPAGSVPRLLGAGRDPQTGRPFLLLELVDGQPLSELLEAGWEPTLAHILAVLRPVADVLDAIHANAIWHRDLSPDNLLVERSRDGVGRVTVIDFGVAKHEYMNRQALDGGMFGKPAYMSPEQCQGREGGPASDLYALGVILYQMLTGVVPYQSPAGNPLEVMEQHASSPIPELPQEHPAALREVVKHLLAKSPADRPKLAADAIRVLEQLVAAPTPQPSATSSPHAATGQPAPAEARTTVGSRSEDAPDIAAPAVRHGAASLSIQEIAQADALAVPVLAAYDVRPSALTTVSDYDRPPQTATGPSGTAVTVAGPLGAGQRATIPVCSAPADRPSSSAQTTPLLADVPARTSSRPLSNQSVTTSVASPVHPRTLGSTDSIETPGLVHQVGRPGGLLSVGCHARVDMRQHTASQRLMEAAVSSRMWLDSLPSRHSHGSSRLLLGSPARPRCTGPSRRPAPLRGLTWVQPLAPCTYQTPAAPQTQHPLPPPTAKPLLHATHVDALGNHRPTASPLPPLTVTPTAEPLHACEPESVAPALLAVATGLLVGRSRRNWRVVPVLRPSRPCPPPGTSGASQALAASLAAMHSMGNGRGCPMGAPQMSQAPRGQPAETLAEDLRTTVAPQRPALQAGSPSPPVQPLPAGPSAAGASSVGCTQSATNLGYAELVSLTYPASGSSAAIDVSSSLALSALWVARPPAGYRLAAVDTGDCCGAPGRALPPGRLLADPQVAPVGIVRWIAAPHHGELEPAPTPADDVSAAGVSGVELREEPAAAAPDAALGAWPPVPPEPRELHRFHEAARSVAVTPDGALVVACGRHANAVLIRMDSGDVTEVKSPATMDASSAVVANSGTLFALAGEPWVGLWPLDDGPGRLLPQAHSSRVRATAFGDAGDLLFSGDEAGQLWAWHLDEGRHSLVDTLGGWVTAITAMPGGASMLSVCARGELQRWNTDGLALHQSGRVHRRAPLCLAVSSDGCCVAVGGKDKVLRLTWSKTTGRPTSVLEHRANVWAVAFAGDEAVLSADQRGLLRWWQLRTESETVIADFGVVIRSMVYDRANHRAVVGLGDGRVACVDL